MAISRTVPLILAVALFMENMDSTVIATSLPAIAADIGTNPIALKLALTSYLVSLAIFIPVSSWMADRYGAKNVFRAAIAVFVLGSLMCAASGSLGAFVVSRFLQGMGGAMMTPVARLVLVRATQRSELVSAMAWLTVPGLIGPLVGPPVGGFITTYFSWHWIFLINLPIGLAGIALATRFLPEVAPAGVGPLDTLGFFLSAVAASGIVFGLSVISMPALPPAIGVAATATGIAAGFIYMRHAWRRTNPILDPRLFGNRVFALSISGGSIFRIGGGATPFLLPLMFQLGFGLTPFESGMLTFATALGAIAMKFIAPTTLRLGGFRTVLVASTLGVAAFTVANAFITPETSYGVIITLLFGAGFMRSLFFTSANALTFAEVDNRDASQATAILAFSQQLSIALGVAAAGLILEGYTAVTGRGLDLTAFSAAFMIIAMIMAIAALPLMQLQPSAGSGTSGHRGRGETSSPE